MLASFVVEPVPPMKTKTLTVHGTFNLEQVGRLRVANRADRNHEKSEHRLFCFWFLYL
jgi:hypothetical protein